jgi:NRPS condensation-like uncharacterized protein
MYDELRLLPLFWRTSECTFKTYLQMKNSPAVDVMYEDMIKEKGVLLPFHHKSIDRMSGKKLTQSQK